MTSDERVDLIMEYEGGDITPENFFKLFSDLIKTGLCWSLQGFYGRTARELIDNGYISKEGEILKSPTEC